MTTVTTVAMPKLRMFITIGTVSLCTIMIMPGPVGAAGGQDKSNTTDTVMKSASQNSWINVDNIILFMENLNKPISLSELAHHIGFTESDFLTGYQRQKLMPSPNIIQDLSYYSNMSQRGIKFSFSIYNGKWTKKDNYKEEQKISLGLDFRSIQNTCITFNIIRPDAHSLGWEGREPGYHTGADGVPFIDYDYVYFIKSGSTAVMKLDKKTKCLESILVTTRNLETSNDQ